MAKPNVQILQIWTFATGLLNLLRRPSFFFPTHKWGSCFSRPIYGAEKNTCEKNVRKTRESEGRRSPQIPLESEGTPEKGPSSAVENRLRFSTADGEKKNLRFFFCPPFRFTARRANLMNGFAGACLKFFLPSHLWRSRTSKFFKFGLLRRVSSTS